MGNSGKIIATFIGVLFWLGWSVSGVQSPALAIAAWLVMAALCVVWVNPYLKKLEIPEAAGQWAAKRRFREVSFVGASKVEEEFVDEGLLAVRSDRWDKMQNIKQERVELVARIEEMRKQLTFGVGGITRPDPAASLMPELQDLTTQVSEAENSWFYASRAVNRSIVDQLIEGKLVARAFRDPHEGGRPDVIIRKEEWRILELDMPRQEAAGKNVRYIGVAIGRVF